MKRKDILNISFWILLIILVILILWRIFGNSPSDIAIMIASILTVLFKMWAISDELREFKHEVKFSFHKIKEDISNIDNKIKKRKNKLFQLKEK